MTASLMKTMFKEMDFKTYQGLTHSSSDEELQEIKQFVEKYLPSQ